LFTLLMQDSFIRRTRPPERLLKCGLFRIIDLDVFDTSGSCTDYKHCCRVSII
jgi:hypothetical protein